jgi:hypothetical protein
MGLRRGTALVAAAVIGLTVSGCTKHEKIALVHSCPPVAGKTVVVSSDKGEIGLAKIALTGKELKADDCRS